MKKGQVTIFIIIAVVLIVAIAGGTYIVSQNKKAASLEYFASSSIKPSLNSINSRIIDCSEETSKQALNRIGLQGGYYNKPQKFNDLDSSFIPYYYHEGEYLMPTKETIETELALYVNENLGDCINNIINKIDKVDGDFRQTEIKKKWKNLLDGDERFVVADVILSCSTGTYIRAIADDLGKEFGGGLLLSLKRTKVGKFEIRDSLKLR